MKNSLRKRQKKTYRKYKVNNRKTKRRSGGFINSSNITDAYKTATQGYQNLYEAYSGLKQKYQDSMQQYEDIKQKYDAMKAKMIEISSDPEVQKHLDTLSTLHSQISNTIVPNNQNVTSQDKIVGGFFDTSTLYKGANTSYTNRKQQFNTVYKNPQVQKNLKDLSSHSYNTAKHGTLFGVNVATGSPISATYRGYNTYRSARKGIKSAKNLYSTANEAYKSSIPQANI